MVALAQGGREGDVPKWGDIAPSLLPKDTSVTPTDVIVWGFERLCPKA